MAMWVIPLTNFLQKKTITESFMNISSGLYYKIDVTMSII